jgi:hypothetical protein
MKIIGKAAIGLASVAVATCALGACSPQSASHASTSNMPGATAIVATHNNVVTKANTEAETKAADTTAAPVPIIRTGSPTSTTQVMTINPITPAAPASEGATVPAEASSPDGTTGVTPDGSTKTAYKSTQGKALSAWGSFGFTLGAAGGVQLTPGQAAMGVIKSMGKSHS